VLGIVECAIAAGSVNVSRTRPANGDRSGIVVSVETEMVVAY
jgi:hypothetical protein